MACYFSTFSPSLSLQISLSLSKCLILKCVGGRGKVAGCAEDTMTAYHYSVSTFLRVVEASVPNICELLL